MCGYMWSEVTADRERQQKDSVDLTPAQLGGSKVPVFSAMKVFYKLVCYDFIITHNVAFDKC